MKQINIKVGDVILTNYGEALVTSLQTSGVFAKIEGNGDAIFIPCSQINGIKYV